MSVTSVNFGKTFKPRDGAWSYNTNTQAQKEHSLDHFYVKKTKSRKLHIGSLMTFYLYSVFKNAQSKRSI